MPQQSLSRYSDTPLYNIKAAEQATGVAASTLRVWERRYGVPRPNRNETGYRLYSERDVATVSWLKGQLDEGLSISQAVARLGVLRQGGDEPSVHVGSAPATHAEPGLRSLAALQDALIGALLEFQAARADEVLAEAFALYPLETVALQLIQPALIEIGEGWRRGEVSIAQEHFGSAHLRQRLGSLFNQALLNHRAPLIVCACARGELHEIGLLLVALFLRRRGYNVVYLGPNVPEDELLQTARRTGAACLCLSASTAGTADALRAAAERVAALPEPRPIFGYGGRVFWGDAERRDGIPGLYLGDDAQSSADTIAALLTSQGV